jgi:hypothetical protein
MCLAKNDAQGARQHLQEALTIFQRLGAMKDIERAQNTLAEITG